MSTGVDPRGPAGQAAGLRAAWFKEVHGLLLVPGQVVGGCSMAAWHAVGLVLGGGF